MESLHTAIHISDYTNNSNDFHTFQSHDDSHQHSALNVVNKDNSDGQQGDQLPIDVGPKKIQITQNDYFRSISSFIKNSYFIDIEEIINIRYLEYDSPPPDLLI